MPYNPKFYDAAEEHPAHLIVQGWFSLGQYMGIEYETPIQFQLSSLLQDAPASSDAYTKRQNRLSDEQRRLRILALKAKYKGVFVPQEEEGANAT